MLREFPGLTACIGVVWRGMQRRGRNGTRAAVSFMLFRRISNTHPDPEAVHSQENPLLDNIVMDLTVARHWYDGFRIAQGDVVHLIPFFSLVTNLRELNAIHAVGDLPNGLQNILFGSDFDSHPGHLPTIRFPRNRQ